MQRRPLFLREPSPQVPRRLSTRAMWTARQRIDDGAGRFNERLFVIDFANLTPGTADQVVFTVTSLGGRFVRCLAMRGVFAMHQPPQGTEAGSLLLRVQLGGSNDLIGQQGGSNFATFATLFSGVGDGAPRPDPVNDVTWLTWMSPPYFRAGDQLTFSVVNDNTGEGAPDLQPSVALLMIDEDIWQELWNRDVRGNRGSV